MPFVSRSAAGLSEAGKLGLYDTWEEAEPAETKRVELKRVEVVHAGAKLEAALKRRCWTREDGAASLVNSMRGTKGKLQEERKWSNWIRQLVNGSNKTHCNDLDRPKMAELRRLVVQASAKLREGAYVRCLRKVVGEIRRGFWDSKNVTRMSRGGGLELGERRLGGLPYHEWTGR